jgi:hypothetical protein
MDLQQIVDELHLKPITDSKALENIPVTSAYASDLLSCVMAGAKSGGVWITLQAHMNVVAVASLLDISAVILTENAQPDPAVLEKANEQGVRLLSSPHTSFTICGQLWSLGLRAS